MEKIKEINKANGIQRRSFFKLLGLSSLTLGLGWPFLSQWRDSNKIEMAFHPESIWRTDENSNKYFIQSPNIQTDLINGQGILKAKVDGRWRTYKIKEFNDDFHEWWVSEKIWYLDQLIAFLEGETDELNIPNGGHHHPILSTYGRKFKSRGDSEFHLNATAKGFNLIPKPEYLESLTTEINTTFNIENPANNLIELLKLKKKLYQDKSLWDKTRFVTLELYTARPINPDDPAGGLGFTETHTFQNLYVNPMATLTYLSIFSTDGTQTYFEGLPYLSPHFEFRGLGWLISYYNPQNTDYEKAASDYVNQSHCQFHGGNCDIITNIFLVLEEFNNTPGYRPGLGKRVVPPYNYNLSSTKVYKEAGKTHSPLSTPKPTLEERIDLIKKWPVFI